MVAKNAWVQIHKILLQPAERAENLPEDTRKVPFEMWDKGFLTADADLGEEVTVITATGRSVTGTLIAENPSYLHNYGQFVRELLDIDQIVKTTLYGDRR